MKNPLFISLAGCVLAAALLGCSSKPNLGHVDMQLVDAGSADLGPTFVPVAGQGNVPVAGAKEGAAVGVFQHVNLVVSSVSIHRDGSGWETIKTDSSTYDLVRLQGIGTTMASADVPAGHYTQIRLLIGQGSNVVVDGETHPVEIPSGMESGYKLIGPFDVPAGGSVDLTIDFDAAKSLLLQPDGTYKLKPTVRLVTSE